MESLWAGPQTPRGEIDGASAPSRGFAEILPPRGEKEPPMPNNDGGNNSAFLSSSQERPVNTNEIRIFKYDSDLSNIQIFDYRVSYIRLINFLYKY